MKKVSIILALAIIFGIVVTASTAGDTPSAADFAVDSPAKSELSGYVVVLAGAPVVAYDGDLNYFAATRPQRGEKVDVNSRAVQQYASFLEARQRGALQQAGATTDRMLNNYVYSLNGFAANLTEIEANELRSNPDVLFVFENEMRQLETDASGDFLGLNDPRGARHRGFDGEGIVIGVVDSGIWPEAESFADPDPNGVPYAAPPITVTECDFGNTAQNPLDAPFTCNNKLLGAYDFTDGYIAAVGGSLAPFEFYSARDADGHGTHTASTAGGNADTTAVVVGSPLATISGVAPRAHIVAYKACGDLGCVTSDLVGAIDQAVADGVDVINYSIGSSVSDITGPDDIAFLFAADAGVFVATSNGNSGPGPATTGSPASSPWVTSVGASTHDRTFAGSATTGDGASYTGVTYTGGLASTQIVDAADHGNELCDPAVTFDPPVTGYAVLCLRGGFARVAKSQAVAEQGGVGMILFNADDVSTLNTDNHYVPSLHIQNTPGVAIKDYIAANGASATVEMSGGVSAPGQGSVMAAFSSRGPVGASSDLIKPDVTAPGVNILAAYSPSAPLGASTEYAAISGTSMSSPHVAGLGALIIQAQPGFSPAMVKSALMTTARQDAYKEDASTPADPFDFGAGHVDPSGPLGAGSFVDPGLVYHADIIDYIGFMCEVTPGFWTVGTCDFVAANGAPSDPSDLNVPSIAVGELVGEQTVTRTVYNVARQGRATTFYASVDAPPGVDVTVTPSSMTLRKLEAGTFEVTFTVNGSATLDEYAFGAITWTDSTGRYETRSPIAVRPMQFNGPAEIGVAGTDGSASFDVSFGYSGDYTAAAHGLVPSMQQADTVADDPANDINTALGTCDFGAAFPWPCTGITWHAVSVPAGSAYLRLSLFDDFTDGADDLDLYAWDSAFNQVGGSGSGTSAEQIDVLFPGDTTYFVAVHGWGTDGPDANYTLFSWAFGADEGNMSIDSAPASATLGATDAVDVSWSGLAAGDYYLGAVSHSDDAGIMGLTLISVDTN
ncbi:MAG: S8 family peptidase [Chloroflexota bacterium]